MAEYNNDGVYKLDVVSVRLVEETPIYSSIVLDSPLAAVDAVGNRMRKLDREAIAVISVDSASHPINVNFASMGTLNYSLTSAREILKSAILSNAAGIVLMHNHPSGDPDPSKSDVQLTDQMNQALSLLDIKLLDHIIVGDERHGYFSFLEQKMIQIPRMAFRTDYHDINFNESFEDMFARKADNFVATDSSSLPTVGNDDDKLFRRHSGSGEEKQRTDYDDFYRRIYTRLNAISFDNIELNRVHAPRGVNNMTYDSIKFKRNRPGKTNEQRWLWSYYQTFKKLTNGMKSERVAMDELADRLLRDCMVNVTDVSIENHTLNYDGKPYEILDAWMDEASNIYISSKEQQAEHADSISYAYMVYVNGMVPLEFSFEPTRKDAIDEYRIYQRQIENVESQDVEIKTDKGYILPSNTVGLQSVVSEYGKTIDRELTIRTGGSLLSDVYKDGLDPLFNKANTYELQCMARQLQEMTETGRILLASDIKDIRITSSERDVNRSSEVYECTCNIRGVDSKICFTITSEDNASLLVSPRNNDLNTRLNDTERAALEYTLREELEVYRLENQIKEMNNMDNLQTFKDAIHNYDPDVFPLSEESEKRLDKAIQGKERQLKQKQQRQNPKAPKL